MSDYEINIVKLKHIIVKVKVEILAVNELRSRFLWNITRFIEKQD